MSEELKKEGWTLLLNATKWHYFRDKRSLCGKWMFFFSSDYVNFKQDNNESPDNCAICKRKRLKKIERV